MLRLDLREQGPHALVGGTTGSGKSEFLQTWIMSMASEHSPDRLTFLLIDYKGGAAFAECTQLPHTVGLVTDLNTHLVRRALTSLRAELHYRKTLLNEKGAKDLVSLEKRGDPDAPPSLIIVIDEFAALVGEVPEFVDGIVDVAQRGRSLGLHLIMATQRPAGVIKDNLRANTNLRIALRVADESNSQDVIGGKRRCRVRPVDTRPRSGKARPGQADPFSDRLPQWSKQGHGQTARHRHRRLSVRGRSHLVHRSRRPARSSGGAPRH
ncbi:FtsK/SpoIIIE domain-containing protein [Cryobacterium sp. PH31-O1]|uniref:FtsK/SpoIIIE domain-containing protein n=1 Tax=Cryobacterium sp. PH31-O1 TaxID=3046306 RepID=UPI0024B8B6FA|nr:FtsK/SpoIIIE domain-containing protein [Cryobacterium sp. PH31-O1]MDJ0339728.1 FtsK/SpoIIIE domain-containing protein [Cryobacterium sp. PH31-O1]